ncbi:MAG: phenylalanine--tRNA ligase subunit beta [Chloroflexi bacterium]|nr:phenylalanine--tRNA ligase subunit beta [Chloroflexota bacterium]
MLFPLSWIKDFVDITIPLELLVRRMIMAGLEVEELRYVGMPMPEAARLHRDSEHSPQTKVTGLGWDEDKFVVGEVLEVMAHPNADRLVLLRLNDGDQEHVVLTGAPNLMQFKDQGALDQTIKVAYARLGARLYDGHKSGWEVMTLEPATIRGVESSSMACSEKELGISEDHEGIIILDDDAPTGMPLADYMGDIVLDIAITPNIARVSNIIGIAREISALTASPFKSPNYDVVWTGEPIAGRVELEITVPQQNPRFVVGLIEGVIIQPSPYNIQRRLKLAGIRPINNVVDATNYAMLEIGEPLHAFDYDVLVERASSKPPKILTRLAHPNEKLITLDGEERELNDFNVLVTDSVGPLSLAGIMGGKKSEVGEHTTNVLLEGAAWNFINIRRSAAAQGLTSEAAYRFSRGVHPAMAERGVRTGLRLMKELSGGIIAQGLVDAYPLPPDDPIVDISPKDVKRWLGIDLMGSEMAEILERLDFIVELDGDNLRVHTPDHRLDIGEGEIGKADLMEEIARIYGYDKIPESQIADTIPPQYGNPALDLEEHLRDLLVNLGLQEVITYRLTSIDQEGRRFPKNANSDDHPFVTLSNPIASDRVVMRHSVLASILEVVERNVRLRDRLALFEIGPVYLVNEDEPLPEEKLRLAIALTGLRSPKNWQGDRASEMDFFDLKGIVEALFLGLDVTPQFGSLNHPTFHPGKSSQVLIEGQLVGEFGELHPLVKERYDLLDAPVLIAELRIEDIFARAPKLKTIVPIHSFPPVLEDLAIVVDEDLPAEAVVNLMRKVGKDLLVDVRLFDVYRGHQIAEGRKSLAYALVYQSKDRTLTDKEITKLRNQILDQLQEELGAVLRE